MMKKITTILMCIMLVTTAFVVSAQNTETKVSQQIKVLDWLDAAVVDGNQVEGGLHLYYNWTSVKDSLKKAQQKKGMLVTVIDPANDNSDKIATFRLNVAPKASLDSIDFVRLDNIMVADTAARNDLIDEIGTTDVPMAAGTIVTVQDDGSGEYAAFLYTGVTDREWVDLSGAGSSGGGYIAVGQGVIGYTNGFDKDDSGAMNKDNVGIIDVTIVADKIDTFEEFEFALTVEGGAPFVCFPKAWNKPTFIIDMDGTECALNDCWKISYDTKNGVEYQQWNASFDFTKGFSGGVLKLIVR